MNLAEQLLLLALDPERGTLATGVDRRRLRRGIAAAVVAELALHGRLRGDEHGVSLGDNLPDFDPLLDQAAAKLRGAPSPMPITDAVAAIDRGLGDTVKRVTRTLVARDILHDYRQAFFFHYHPVRSMQALREVYAVMTSVGRDKAPAMGAIALAAVADACGVLSVRMTPGEAIALRERLAKPVTAGDRQHLLLVAIGDAGA